MWPFITQRPFNKVANPSDKPKSIIVSLANTAPLSVDYDFTLSSKKDEISKRFISLFTTSQTSTQAQDSCLSTFL